MKQVLRILFIVICLAGLTVDFGDNAGQPFRLGRSKDNGFRLRQLQVSYRR